MASPTTDKASTPIEGLSIRLDDGTVVSLDAVIAEGRRQRARELRRLTRAAFRWIARTMRPLLALVPGPDSKRMIPPAFVSDHGTAMARAGFGRVAAEPRENPFVRLGKALFETDAALGHVAAAAAEDTVDDTRADLSGERVKAEDRRLAA